MSTSLKGEVTVREPTPAQRAIARRVAEAKATIPEITLDAEIEIDAVVAFRGGLIDPDDGHAPPSLRDFIVKAAGLALREFPMVNSSYRDGRFELYSRVNVGITVAGDGFVAVPTILDADRKSLKEIASETRALTDRANQRVVSAAELAGATFTVSDAGVDGIARFQAVINPPQAAILAVGTPRSAVAIDDGQLRERQVATVSMSCDHRILYGADAGAFLNHLRALLARPQEWCG